MLNISGFSWFNYINVDMKSLEFPLIYREDNKTPIYMNFKDLIYWPVCYWGDMKGAIDKKVTYSYVCEHDRVTGTVTTE